MSSPFITKLEHISSDFKIFTTNQGKNTLKNHLTKMLKEDKNITYFDILIGFFRMSGFNEINTSLNEINELRILVGMKTEKSVLNATNLIDDFIQGQIEDWENAINEDRYKSVNALLKLLKNNKLKIRVSPNNNNHSKLYILRNKENSRGGVIIGSSNLTYNGLEANFEINTTLTLPQAIDEATQLFNILWSEAQELTLKDVEDKIIPKLKNYPLKQKMISQENITPYQAYIKVLQVYFNNRIDLINFDDEDMPKDFKSFNYQSDAVQDGIDKLNKYNGFYLADVVGLGKTIVAILIIKKLRLKTIVIAPKSVLKQWKKAIKDFYIQDITCMSKDSIPQSSDAELIVIDEAHNFRNTDTDRYERLEYICKSPYQKKVMLLSATPQNNEPNDIANQLYLFQNQNNSNIPNLLKLKTFFDEKNKQYKEIIQDTIHNNKKALDLISTEIKNSVLKYIMTRRTRTDIENCEMYKSDIESFPKLNELTPLEYELKDDDLIEKYNMTVSYLQTELEYARFKSLNQLNKQGRDAYKSKNPTISENVFKDNPLAKLMQIQLVKRFESSFEAFKISLKRHTRRLENFLKMFDDNIIYLGKYSNDFLDNKEDYIIEDDRLSYINKKGYKRILQGHVFTKDDFEDNFRDLLQKDLRLFKQLNKQWKNEKRDPKIALFKKELKKYSESKTKVVVFTESQDTGKYLYKNLQSKKLKILYVDSNNRDELIDVIAQNFDANYKQSKQADNYNIIITTDTLAEGINLHRSNTIYNYDIPWNATKLMQRIGRINRIGSQAKRYNVFNFKPVAKSEEIIGLSHKAHTKLQAFHSTYGEDNKIYTDEEDVESKELFEIVKKQKEEIDEELIFLQELRTFKDEHLSEFLMIEKLSDDLTLAVANNPNDYGYKKGDTTHKFYFINEKVQEIDFITFATNLKALTYNSKTKLNNEQIETIQKQIVQYYQINTIEKNQRIKNNKRTPKKDTEAILILQDYGEDGIISEELYESAEKLIRDGVYSSSFTSEILTSTSSTIKELLEKKIQHENLLEIPIKEQLKSILTIMRG